MAGKIQKQDVKTEAELISAGATASSLIQDTQIYVSASGINKTLDDAIVDGDVSGDLKVSVQSGTSFTIDPGFRYYCTNAGLVTATLSTTGFTQGKRFGIVAQGAGGVNLLGSTGSHQFLADTRTSFVGLTAQISLTEGDCVEIDAVTANTLFRVVNSQGSFDVSNYQYQGNTYSYFMGGAFYSAVVDRLTYSGEGIAATSSVLTVARTRGARGHSTTKGFGMGGRSGAGVIATSDAITFAGEVIAAITSLTTARQMSASGSTNLKSYAIAGDTAAGTGSAIQSIEALTHVGETFATLAAVTSSSRSFSDSSGQSSTKIYGLGGHTGTWGGAGAVTTIDALVTGAETCGSIGSVLSATKIGGCGVCSTTATYLVGGSTDGSSGNSTNVIEKLNFADEVRSTLAAVSSSACQAGGGSPSTLKGYSAIGLVGGLDVNTVDALVFSSELNAALGNTLTTARGGTFGVQI